jgi:hypothetical protein
MQANLLNLKRIKKDLRILAVETGLPGRSMGRDFPCGRDYEGHSAIENYAAAIKYIPILRRITVSRGGLRVQLSLKLESAEALPNLFRAESTDAV